ncbi:hypothetical protein [Dickeya dianthicola]|uniref:hypothetical protein n=1 Tax=Dickeya dianthicola TaxID=204039 RepID=UPI0018DFED19|nr:hypothetical protein [Dickeya dianthicola]
MIEHSQSADTLPTNEFCFYPQLPTLGFQRVFVSKMGLTHQNMGHRPQNSEKIGSITGQRRKKRAGRSRARGVGRVLTPPDWKATVDTG